MDAFETIKQELARLNWNKEPHGLYEPIDYALSSGGKRLRPALTLIAADIYNADPQLALPAALALELFHNFTLLHDDVMDNAKMRRGKPCVHIRWDANTAILSGDQMLIEAYGKLQSVPPTCLEKVMALFTKMATEICEGQQYDMDFEKRDNVTIPEYIEMIRLKTSVLLGTALQLGAYIAGATDEEQLALYDYGVNIGIAFQLQDDLLDVYGNPDTFGKVIGGDILEGKKTYLLLTALRAASDTRKQQLLRQLHAPANTDREMQQKIAAVTAIYDKLNVREACEDAVKNYTQTALAQLEKLKVSTRKKNILVDLANRLLARKE